MAMILVIVVTVCLCMLTTVLIMRGQLLEKTSAASQKDLRMISEKIDMLIREIENDAVRILSSDPCQSLLSRAEQEGLDTALRYKLYRSINESMISFLGSDAIYHSVVFYDAGGNAYMTGNMRQDESLLQSHTEKALQIFGGNENAVWQSLHESPWRENKATDSSHCISYFRKVYARDSGALLGVMELEIQSKVILSLYSSLIGNGDHIYITDDQGRILSSDQTDRLYDDIAAESWYPPSSEDAGRMRESGQMFYNTLHYEPLDYTIVYASSKRGYQQDLFNVTLMDTLIAIMLIVPVSVLSRLLIHSIVKPIGIIVAAIKKISAGNYQSRIEATCEGEFLLLANEFNRMIDNTNVLMERIRQTERLKRESELNLIQLQMTPHFFYNILESICGLIVLNEKQTAIRTIQHLSDFYRGVLGKGKDVIPLRDELGIARNYLEIMRVCYPDAFTYRIACGDEAAELLICKLTLQPILENAVYHGILAGEGSGHIDIEAVMTGDTLHVCIRDDGKGISDDKLRELYLGKNPGYMMDSFGIRNTNDRIKLYFGEAYGLTIDSALGKGTCVYVSIPAEKGESACTPY